MRVLHVNLQYLFTVSAFALIAGIGVLVLIFIDYHSFQLVSNSKTETTGTVIDKQIESGGRAGTHYTINYKFRTSNGQYVENTQPLHINQTLYNSVSRGSEVTIDYDSANPAHSFINGTEPSAHTYLLEAGLAALFSVLAAFSVFYFKKQGSNLSH